MNNIWLKKIQIQNYGPFINFEVSFEKYFNTFIGKNGIGKSFLLNAINEFTSSTISDDHINRKIMQDAIITFIFYLENEISFDYFKIPSGELYFQINSKDLKCINVPDIQIDKENQNGDFYFKFEFMPEFKSGFIELLNNTGLFKPPSSVDRSQNEPLIIFPVNNTNLNQISINQILDSSAISNIIQQDLGNKIKKMEISYSDINGEITFEQNERRIIIQKEFTHKFKKLISIYPIGSDLQGLRQGQNWELILNSIIAQKLFSITNITQAPYDTSFNISKIYEFQENFINFTHQLGFNDFPRLSFNILNDQFQVMAHITTTSRVHFWELSEGQQWVFKFLIFLYPYYQQNQKNVIITIDEPGKNIHPIAQEYILNAIKRLSHEFQIIYTTHMTHLLDYTHPNTIKLMYKINDDIKIADVPNNNKIFVCDELQRLSPLQFVSLIIEDNYECIQKDLLQSYKNLDVFKRLQRYLKENIGKIKDLGTKREEQKFRLLNSTFFLLNSPIEICSTPISTEFSLKQVLLFQCLKNKQEELDSKKRFKSILSNWEQGEDQNKLALKKIINPNLKIVENLKLFLDRFSKIEWQRCLVLIPECVLNLEEFDQIEEICNNNELVLITGLVHISFNKFQNIKKNKFENKADIIDFYQSQSEKNFYLNLTAIYDYKNQKWYAQPKNIPVITKIDEKIIEENIVTLIPPRFYIFELSLGRVAIFTCKDFLVYHDALPRWMEMHRVDLILIPSFSEKVGTFIRKMQEITSKSSQKMKIYAYSNLAEYGGSDVINFSTESRFEPDRILKSQREEAIFIFNLEQKDLLFNIKPPIIIPMKDMEKEFEKYYKESIKKQIENI